MPSNSCDDISHRRRGAFNCVYLLRPRHLLNPRFRSNGPRSKSQTRFILKPVLFRWLPAYMLEPPQRSDSKTVYTCVYYTLFWLWDWGNGDQKWSHLLQLSFFGRNHVKSCRYHLILQVDLQAPRCFFNVGLHSKFLQTGPTSYTKLITKRDIKWYHACDSSVCASASAAATHLQIALLCSCADEACVCDEVRLLPKQSKHECGFEGGSEWWAAFHGFTGHCTK